MGSIDFTVARSDSGIMTKVFYRGPDGSIVKDGSHCAMSSGVARRIKLPRDATAALSEFAIARAELKQNEAIIRAPYTGPEDEIRVVRKADLPDGGGEGITTRTKGRFANPKGSPALLAFDLDLGEAPDWFVAMVRAKYDGDAWAFIRDKVPEFRSAAYLRVPSSSGRVYDPDRMDEAENINAHIYVVVSDAADIEWLEKNLLLVLTDPHVKGAYVKISVDGKVLDRCVIDHQALGAERLIFEAEPVVRDGLALRPLPNSAMQVVPGGYLDVAALRKRFTRYYRDRAREELDRLRGASRREAWAVRRAYREEKTAEQIARGKTPEEADRIIRKRMGGVLDPEDGFETEDGRRPIWQDVLNDLDAFDGVAILHPISGVRNKTIIKARPDHYEGPIAISLAHGGAVFHIGRRWPKKRPGRRRITLEPWGAPLPELPERVPLDQLRDEQRRFIQDAVEQTSVIATVLTTMGSGKNTVANEAIIDRNEADRRAGRTVRRALVMLSQHAQIKEKVREFNELAAGTSVTCYGYVGRVRPKKKDPNVASQKYSSCERAQIVHEASRAGITTIKQGFCSRELSDKEMAARNTDDRFIRCPLWDECQQPGSREGVENYYYGMNQCANSDVVFASHVFVDTWQGDIGTFDTFVVDENALSEILDERTYWVSTLEREASRCGDEDRSDLMAVLAALRDEAAQNIPAEPVIVRRLGEGAASKAKVRLEELAKLDAFKSEEPDLDPGMPEDAVRLELPKIKRYAWPVVLKALHGELGTGHARFYGVGIGSGGDEHAGNHVHVYRMARLEPLVQALKNGGVVLFLDGTTTKRVATQVMEWLWNAAATGTNGIETRFFERHARSNMHRTAVLGRTMSRRQLGREKPDGTLLKQSARAVRRWVDRWGLRSVLVATYMSDCAKVAAALDAEGLGGLVSVHYFETLKALNEFKAFDGVVQIGRPLTPVEAVLTQARALYAREHGLDLNLSPDYEKVDVPLRLTEGGALKVQAWRHPDPRVDELRWMACEGLMQQVDERLRGVSAVERKYSLIIGDGYPYPVDEVMLWDEATGDVPEWLQTLGRLLDEDGVLVLSKAHLARRASVTVDAAEWVTDGAKAMLGIDDLELVDVPMPFLGDPHEGDEPSDRPLDALLPGVGKGDQWDAICGVRPGQDGWEYDVRMPVPRRLRVFWIEASGPKGGGSMVPVVSAICDPLVALDRLRAVYPELPLKAFGAVDELGQARSFTADLLQFETFGVPLSEVWDADCMVSAAYAQSAIDFSVDARNAA